jgi:hypothetical protein
LIERIGSETIEGYHRIMRLLSILLLALTASSSPGASFSEGTEVARFPAELDEISGMAQSRTQKDVFWVHNDSGDQARVYAVSRQGKLLGTFLLKGASAVDWEDMAIGPAPGGGSYLYLADIGDNAGRRASVRVYRVREPRVDPADAPVTKTLQGVVAFNFVYEDGPRDAEGFMVDPLTNDFYVVTKREDRNRLYRYHAPSARKVNILHLEASLPFTGVTGADISPDGMQVLIRRYSLGFAGLPLDVAASHWQRKNATTSLVDLLRQPGEMVPLVMEVQGEAIAFSYDNHGFYTTSERGGPASAPAAPLTFYAPAR